MSMRTCECSDNPFICTAAVLTLRSLNSAATGDWMHNSRPNLETVIDSGVRTVVFDGDADFILNFKGVEAMVDALDTKFTSTFAQQEFSNFTVKGVSAGLFKNAGTFSYVRFFGAGHEVPAYEWPGVTRGAAALQVSCFSCLWEALS